MIVGSPTSQRRLAALVAGLLLLGFAGTGGADMVGGRVRGSVPDLDEARRRRDVLLPRLRDLIKEDVAIRKEAALRPVPMGIPVAPTAAPPLPASAPADEPPWVHLRLDDAVETALRHNLPVQIARLNRDTVEYEIPKAQAIFHPTVGMLAEATGEREVPEDDTESNIKSRTGRAFVNELLPIGTNLQVSNSLGRQDNETLSERDFSAGFLVTVRQPLLRGGGIVVVTRPVQDARFDLRVEEARLGAETLRVVAAAKSAYYNLLLAEEIIRVTEENIERDKLLVEASRELLDAGMVTKRDLFSAEFLLDSDTNRLVEANAARDSARNTLMDVLGIPIGSQVTLLDRNLEIDPLALKVERWIDTAVERRPEVLEVQELLAKNDLDIRVSKNGVFPQLDLVGGYGKSQEASALSRALDLPGEAWTAGLAFSIPIGNVAARSQLAQANVRQRRLEHELTQRKRRVEIEVRNAAIKLSRTTKSVGVLKNAITHLHEKLAVALGQFSLGLATNLDITDAQEDLLDTQTDLLTALTDYHVGLAELEASVAGPL